ncbi:hypothetical protein EBT25_17005 [bacterium]|nr:hypothetical protein [bacterium]
MKVSKEPILWALKCRSGKSYLMAALIAHRITIAPKSSFLVITPIPKETIQQLEAMFRRHIEFASMNVVILQATNVATLDLSKPSILLASKQFLQNKDIPELRRLNLDTVFFDETHEGGSTYLSRTILYRYAPNYRIFLTATYHKPQYAWCISPDRKMQWDMMDEQFCKENDLAALEKRHGPLVTKIAPAYNLPESYRTYPRMKILSHFLNPEQVHEIRDSVDTTSYGLNMDDLFAIVHEKKTWRFTPRKISNADLGRKKIH